MSTKPQDPGDGPDIPEQSWTNPFPEGFPLHDLYDRRVRNEQDLIILIDDYHARRGTAKTTASLKLAEGMDQNGGITMDNVSTSAEEIRNAYDTLPKRSGIVFDEGEIGASNREAMTISNRALREIVSIGRVEQKYVVINTPSVGFIDKDIRLLADVWGTMLGKGLLHIHYLKRLPYANQLGGKLLTEKKGLMQFKDIPRGTRLRKVYLALDKEKRRHISGEEGTQFISKNEHEKEVKKAVEEAEREKRNEILRQIYQHPEHECVSQRTLGNSVGLSQPHVGRIL